MNTDTNELIINYTPTGMIPIKAMNHHVPISAEEIVGDVMAAVDIGITMVMLGTGSAVMDGVSIGRQPFYTKYHQEYGKFICR